MDDANGDDANMNELMEMFENPNPFYDPFRQVRRIFYDNKNPTDNLILPEIPKYLETKFDKLKVKKIIKQNKLMDEETFKKHVQTFKRLDELKKKKQKFIALRNRIWQELFPPSKKNKQSMRNYYNPHNSKIKPYANMLKRKIDELNKEIANFAKDVNDNKELKNFFENDVNDEEFVENMPEVPTNVELSELDEVEQNGVELLPMGNVNRDHESADLLDLDSLFDTDVTESKDDVLTTDESKGSALTTNESESIPDYFDDDNASYELWLLTVRNIIGAINPS